MKLTPKLALILILYAVALLAGVGLPAYSSGREALRFAALSELSADSVIVKEATALFHASSGSPEANTARRRHL